ncbi:MAG TPA: Hsp20/alpha crystallin family protein [Bryobacteraceae bacterium]|nr:Hsp20/alpha crystallin family protein [Bryobacteraceae bacterium]
MPSIAIQRTQETSGKTLPLLQEIENRIEDVRRRAFEFFEGRGGQSGRDIEDWLRAEHEVLGWPAAELAETDADYKLEMTLPGFDAKQVEVTATPTEIAVHAEIKAEKKGGEPRILWTEFGPNNVYRRFPLPQPIDVDKTTATLDQGLLKIMASKAASAKAKPAAA